MPATKTRRKPKSGAAAGKQTTRAASGKPSPAPAKKSTRRSVSTPSGKPKSPRRSRAVVRSIEAGSAVSCQKCDERVKFQAKIRAQQVICNVYVKGVWDRVEHFHSKCYGKAGKPYGEAAA